MILIKEFCEDIFFLGHHYCITGKVAKRSVIYARIHLSGCSLSSSVFFFCKKKSIWKNLRKSGRYRECWGFNKMQHAINLVRTLFNFIFYFSVVKLKESLCFCGWNCIFSATILGTCMLAFNYYVCREWKKRFTLQYKYKFYSSG